MYKLLEYYVLLVIPLEHVTPFFPADHLEGSTNKNIKGH